MSRRLIPRVEMRAGCAGALLGLLMPMSALAQADAPEALETVPEVFDTIALPPTPPATVDTVIVLGQREIPPAPRTGLDGAAHTQPLSVVTVTRQELEARGARDITQALETVAAVNAPVPFMLQAGNQYDVRGFGATVLVDGFSSLGLYGDRESLAGIERVDFVKGPGSSLSGGALGLPPGGVIDLHSSWPGATQALRVETGVARYGQRRHALELDSGDLIPVLSLGLAAEDADGEGFFDFSRLERRKLRPSLSLRALGGRLSVYHEDSRRTQTDHPGLPTRGTLDRSAFTIADSRSVNDPDVPLSRSRLRATGVDAEIPLGSTFTLSAAARRSESTLSQASQFVSSNTPDTDPTGLLAPTTFNRSAGTYVQDTEEKQARVRVDAQRDVARAGRFKAWVGYGGEDAPDFVELRAGLATPLDLVNPQYGSWAGAPIPFAEARSHFRIRNLSTGLQWRYADWLNSFVAHTQTRATVDNRQTSVTDQTLRELLGDAAAAQLGPVLNGVLDAGGLSTALGASVDRTDRYDLGATQFGVAARLWKAGAVAEEDGLWLFYGQGEGHQFRSYFTGEAQPLPELSEQRESGLRWVNGDWGRVEVTAFDIERRNVPTSAGGFVQVTTGLQSVRGVDLEFTLRAPLALLERFTLDGSAAWLDSRIDEDGRFPSGNELADVPRRNWRVQLAAEVLRGSLPLRAFVTQRCRSAVQGDLANSFVVPSRCLQDAGATLRWRGLSLDAVIQNLADERYYEPYTYLFFGVIPGERRNARLTLGYEFGSS